MTNCTKTLIATAIAGILGSTAAFAAPSFEQKDITEVGWKVEYVESQYDAASNTTTFSYELIAASSEKDLSHWVLGNDSEGDIPSFEGSCANEGFGLDPTTGVSGLKCDDGQGAGTSQTYTVVVPGYACAVEVDYAVKGGTYYAVGLTTGPGDDDACAAADPVNTYTLSGSACVDANRDYALGDSEPLLANVTVLLKDASGETIGMKQTDDNGYYEFAGLPAGEYGVEIPAFTDDIDGDFNEQLGAYFAANDPAGLAVSLGTDSTNNDLGFGVDTLAVLDDLDPADADANGYTMIGTGKTIGFWKHQNNVAIKGKGRAQINAETLKGHLDAVEAGWLIGSGTFEFTSGNDYEDAFAILSETSSDEVSLLRKQLLGTELNHVSGGGLVGEDYALQSVLIGWGEYLAVNDSAFTREEILEAKDIFDWINNTGE